MIEHEQVKEPEGTQPSIGRREANKRAKLERIRAAAKKEFLEKGYEDATLRAIATDAEVAFGTLFLYAKNKQDLLLLLFDEQLDAVGVRAFARADPEEAILDQLVEFFEEFYAFFSETPDLSRAMMREVTFTDGIVGPRIWQGAQAAEDAVAGLVARAQLDGQLDRDITPTLAAHVLFSLYRTEIRFYLDEPGSDIEQSLLRLRSQFELVLRGFAVSARRSDRPGI